MLHPRTHATSRGVRGPADPAGAAATLEDAASLAGFSVTSASTSRARWSWSAIIWKRRTGTCSDGGRVPLLCFVIASMKWRPANLHDYRRAAMAFSSNGCRSRTCGHLRDFRLV